MRIVFALALAVMLTAGALAQEKQKKKKGKGPQLNPVTMAMLKFARTHEALTKVELTDEQKEELKKLHESMNPKMEAVMKKIKEIVGEEEMKIAEEARKKAKEAGKTGRQVGVAIEKAVNLSEEQQDKLAVIGKEVNGIHRAMIKKVNTMLTDEQKEKFKEAMTPQRKGGKKKKDE